jgi:hypothetical protein
MLHAMTGVSRTVFHRRLLQHRGSRLLDRTCWPLRRPDQRRRVGLRADRCDPRQQDQVLLVGHRLLPGGQLGPQPGRRLLLLLEDVVAQLDALVAEMYTPGPAITFATAELGLAQNEQFT